MARQQLGETFDPIETHLLRLEAINRFEQLGRCAPCLGRSLCQQPSRHVEVPGATPQRATKYLALRQLSAFIRRKSLGVQIQCFARQSCVVVHNEFMKVHGLLDTGYVGAAYPAPLYRIRKLAYRVVGH